ncbi:Gluconeogenesis factor [Lysinibacillus sphaericus]
MGKKHTRLVVIGGGTGLSTLLRGLKHHPFDITAIVTVADDGGPQDVYVMTMISPRQGMSAMSSLHYQRGATC